MKGLLLFGSFGAGEVIVIALIVLLLFGGKKIPELMKGIGKGVKSFKDGVKGIEDEINADITKDEKKEEETTLQFDLDNRHDRIIRLTRMSGGIGGSVIGGRNFHGSDPRISRFNGASDFIPCCHRRGDAPNAGACGYSVDHTGASRGL